MLECDAQTLKSNITLLIVFNIVTLLNHSYDRGPRRQGIERLQSPHSLAGMPFYLAFTQTPDRVDIMHSAISC